MATENEVVESTENTEGAENGAENSETKWYLSWEGLCQYNNQIKDYIENKLSSKASLNHDHDDTYYKIDDFEEFYSIIMDTFESLNVAKVNEDGFNDRVNEIINSAELITVDEIDGICGVVKDNQIIKLTSDDFQSGTLNTSGILVGGSNVRLFTKNTLSLNDGTISVHCPTRYSYIVYFYNSPTPSESALVGKTTWNSGSLDDLTTISLTSGSIANATHCRVSFRYGDGASVITDYIDELMTNEPIVINKIVIKL